MPLGMERKRKPIVTSLLVNSYLSCYLRERINGIALFRSRTAVLLNNHRFLRSIAASVWEDI